MDWIFDPQLLIAFLTLTVLELVLGIDNVIFISILSGKLPEKDQKKARFIGLALALIMRVILLLSLTWVMGLTTPLFTVWNQSISGRDLILLIGGLFLIAKSTHEIHGSLEGAEGEASRKVYPSFASVIVQIMLLDIVFSLDSVITAVGMVNNIWIMVAAVVVSIIAMMLFAGSIGAFVQRHPTVKMLALAFLLLIGVTLIAEGFHQHIPKGYIYFAMAFSVFVEMLNVRLRKKAPPVILHAPFSEDDERKAIEGSS
jgi:predicted tellurium resistance membrane protein TerC